MKLLRISIHGFKSFADKVSIDIKDGITGIVGPNGSGKSNIVDAVKWVLGEQSVKDLRGGSAMADVIFSGSKSRKSLTRAWVSLTFDNSDYYLKTELSEVEIKRVVYSSGENEYYINNEIVRLKDITNLFIDSGSSVNSLSIISQGKIGEIINGKPEEKRAILEEAAGVLKYKKRKLQTLRKLDKTNDNLSRINLIIDELTINLDPLKEQAELASKYALYKEELEQTEKALIAHDIKTINKSYSSYKEQSEKLSSEIIYMDNSNIVDSAKVDSLKLKLIKVDDEITLKQEELNKLLKELSALSSEKQVMVEREKYNVEDSKLETNLVHLKERELELLNNIKLINQDITSKNKELELKISTNTDLSQSLKTLNIKRNTLLNELSMLSKDELAIKNKSEIIKDNLDNNSTLPYAVKCILNNDRLKGIHNCLGKLIETDERCSLAIDTALGYLSTVIVVDNENYAKESIDYLKSNSFGRATFFPINIIRPRGIDSTTLDKIKDDNCFIGIASKLVKCDPIYNNIVKNQLGNVIVVDNLINANKLGKAINFSYKIVTLSGELIAAGGSITGGASRNNNGIATQKYELENLLLLLKEKINAIKLKEEEINDNNYNLKILETKVFESTNSINYLKENISRIYSNLLSLEESLKQVINEGVGTKGILNKNIDDEIENILKEFYKVKGLKENLDQKLNDLKTTKNDLQSEINELEISYRKVNNNYNKKQSELKEIDITIAKLDSKLDNLLQRLNEEYGITYERAIKEYILVKDPNIARSKVNILKHNIKSLGDVNTGSIAEYERVNTRFEFLTAQKHDLNTSINNILTVIDELDLTMGVKLEKTFTELSSEFSSVFSLLFKGGEGRLVLTDPNDILNTGLEICAMPPGKDIKNTRLLSGGEATLTAIALLFAILNIRTVPFCVLDEVEAALDEVNVDMFGNYLKKLNSKTQFILVTHKKRTMEYTNNLYGITMQESGVSKLVSVMLD